MVGLEPRRLLEKPVCPQGAILQREMSARKSTGQQQGGEEGGCALQGPLKNGA